mmetsp:Transcript_34466/g.41650  ORF Transcript_34466/g.41650 Transcript_34466/m.41650 type:complete len:95 (+) Transcript_34466:887-1171(+)
MVVKCGASVPERSCPKMPYISTTAANKYLSNNTAGMRVTITWPSSFQICSFLGVVNSYLLIAVCDECGTSTCAHSDEDRARERHVDHHMGQCST